MLIVKDELCIPVQTNANLPPQAILPAKAETKFSHQSCAPEKNETIFHIVNPLSHPSHHTPHLSERTILRIVVRSLGIVSGIPPVISKSVSLPSAR